MLPPVFYVQQLEQILLRKLLSPPTPANPARFGPALRRALMSVFNFFVRFFRSVFRAKPCPFDLARLRCAPDALTSIFSFCQPFPFQAAPLWLRACHILFSRFSFFLRPVFPPVL